MRVLASWFIGVVVTALFVIPAAGTAGDPCAEEGISIKNLTTVDLWYTKNKGDCTLWKDDHIVIIRPGDGLGVFRDMCLTEYCGEAPSYETYRTFDADGDCRVRILPRCTLSDM